MSAGDVRRRWTNWFGNALAVIAVCGVVALAWYGYRAATEWLGSSTLLVERRNRDLANLLATALTRDMRGVQTSILNGPDWNARSLEPPFEIDDVVATAFARYPYPDCFFGWRASPGAPVTFFTRADRPPRWASGEARKGQYPVVLSSDDELAKVLTRRVERDALARKSSSAFDVTFGGVAYQAVSRIVYLDDTRERVEAVLGFLVDREWVRANYFSFIAEQASRIEGAGTGLEYAIFDDAGKVVVGPSRATSTRTEYTKKFPALFIDSAVVTLDRPPDLAQPVWTISVSATKNPTLELAAQGARRTLLAIAIAAVLAGLGLIASVRAAQANERVAVMRSEFVSAVTHELKTPLATIRTIADSLVRGRLSSGERVHAYAELLAQEERRLGRLVENLLAYARVTDVADVYNFESLSPAALVAEAVERFRRQLTDSAFRVHVDADPALRTIEGDQTSLVLALDNLIDNAIRYSPRDGEVFIACRLVGSSVEISVKDRGVGIPAEDLERVQKRFVRGRSNLSHGSGLGLAIVNRIVQDHGGTLRLESEPGTGTTATMVIPHMER